MLPITLTLPLKVTLNLVVPKLGGGIPLGDAELFQWDEASQMISLMQ